MIAGSALALDGAFGREVTRIATVGALPAQLPPLSMPDLSIATLTKAAPTALATTILAFTFGVSIRRSWHPLRPLASVRRSVADACDR